MKIIVVGPGAIGSLFSAKLSRTQHEVSILDKDPERARIISKNGLRIEEPYGETTAMVPTTSDPIKAGVADIVCICVKAYDTESALVHALPTIGPETIVVTLQNGLGNLQHIVAMTDPKHAVCAVTSHGATRLGPGHVRHAGTGTTAIASYVDTETEPAAKFAQALTDAGLEATVQDDSTTLVWSKLIVNAAINPVTALADIPNGVLLNRPDLMEQASSAATEAQSVAVAAGVTLSFDDAVAEVTKVCKSTGENISSMLQDLRIGRRTEVEAINGAIVREAALHGINTPTNKMLTSRILARQAG